MPPTIPGMYYGKQRSITFDSTDAGVDTEKRRYMRVLPDRLARSLPSNVASKVSESAVRAEAEQNQREERRQLIEKRRRLECVQRSNALNHDLGGRRLGHELVRTKEPWSRTIAGFWLQGMKPGHRYRDPDHVRDAVRCPQTGNVYMASDKNVTRLR